MIVSEIYERTNLPSILHIYSDSGFFLQYENQLFRDGFVDNEEQIQKYIETNIPLPPIIATNDFICQEFIFNNHLTEKQIQSLITSIISMGGTEIEQLRIPYEGSYTTGRLNAGGAWVIQVDYEANKKALQYYMFGKGKDPGINDKYGEGNDHFVEGNFPEKTEGISTY